jgi:signal transduction histidine kinase
VTAATQIPPPFLIVDDDDAVRAVIDRVVRRVGGLPTFATSRAAALEVLEQQAWACAVVDKNLPNGSGIDVLRRLRTLRPHTPVIMLTAYASIGSAVESLQLGAFDYLEKPFDVDVLTHRLRQGLERLRLEEDNLRLGQVVASNARLISIGTMTAGIAHEANNALGYISNNLSWAQGEVLKLVEQADLPAESRKTMLMDVFQALAESAEGTRRVTAIVGDLKGMSRSDATAGRRFDVEHAVRTAVKLTRLSMPASVSVEVQASPAPAVRANELLITQAIINLLINATQAIPEGRAGMVTLRCGTSAQGGAFVSVQDDGPGIPEAVRPRVFEPFFTTKPPGVGTGLGLPLSRRIVEEVGGALSFETEPGKGTTFTIELPQATGDDGIVPVQG